MDGGINPETVRGSNMSVFVGSGGEEAGEIWKRTDEQPSGYISTGCFTSTIANRLSFAFDLTGPSYAVDCACASSLVVIEHAYNYLKTGLIECAIVAGVHLCLSPLTSMCCKDMGMLSADGKCKTFDAEASGYVRSEAAVVMYLCKALRAKRCYAAILHAKSNSDGYKEQGISFPSQRQLQKLMMDFYYECGVNPADVGYIEAHGTGTKVGDPRELNAIANVFCQGRTKPLLVGSVKSNMGHSEYASGLCGITKVLLSHQHGILPANLHFRTPNPEILSIRDGTIQVVTENKEFKETFAAVNSFGIGGTNAHVLLQFNQSKWAKLPDWSESIPVIIPVSGRTKDSVLHLLSNSKLHSKNSNMVGLFHELAKTATSKHLHRGYICFHECNSSLQIKENDLMCNNTIWYIFTGLGSQWSGMEIDLLKFKPFRNSIARSAETLQRQHFDLFKAFNKRHLDFIDDFKDSLVSITAIQVGLINILKSVGISPDGIIGHSTGECAAAYADGSFTEGQAVLVSLARARAFLESDLPEGTMATIALSWKEAAKRCPNDVYLAISNTEESVTVSGPQLSISALVQELQRQGVFAKQLKSAIYSFHSPYVKNCEALMRDLLEVCIPEPRRRSIKWLSSSIPENGWNSELAKYSSVDYHVNNALSPVLFYETLLHIPRDSIVLEVGPHCFMQTIIKNVLPSVNASFGLMSKHAKNNALYFLNALGHIYLEGINFDVSQLYPKVHFPVCCETPSISPWIVFDHSQAWDVPRIHNELSWVKGVKISIDLQSESQKYLEGHVVNGRLVFPATGYIWLVWKALASQLKATLEQMPVLFENLCFERITVLNYQNVTEFTVVILPEGGKFEVMEGGTAVCRGSVQAITPNHIPEMALYKPVQHKEHKQVLTKADFYKELHIRGYEHKDLFQRVESMSFNGETAELEWFNNWVLLLDAMLQAQIVSVESHRGLYLPTKIAMLSIDPLYLKEHLHTTDSKMLPMNYSKYMDTAQCPGVAMRGLQVRLSSSKDFDSRLMLTENKFTEFFDHHICTLSAALDFCITIVMDNLYTKQPILTELFSDSASKSIAFSVANHCVVRFESPECRLHVSLVCPQDERAQNSTKVLEYTELQGLKPCHLLYVDDSTKFENFMDLVAPFGFILSTKSCLTLLKFPKIASKNCEGDFTLTLYRNMDLEHTLSPVFVNLDQPDYLWINVLKTNMTSKTFDRVIVTTNSVTGAQGLVKCLLSEPGCERVRCLVQSSGAEKLEIKSVFVLKQLKLDLVFNVYKAGGWGCYSNNFIHDVGKPRLCAEVYADITTPGDLTSLTWIESPLKLKSTSNKLVKVAYAALNFRDLMLATGKLAVDALPIKIESGDCVLGHEFSGTQGSRRVCGFNILRCIATNVEPDPSAMWDIPDSWTLEEAATIPAVYVTVYYAMIIRGNMQPGESVLIHAGSGGVGIAAITLALSMQCKVYTTVSSSAKRKFLLNRFPQLVEENITDSRNALTFETHMMELTRGCGVDIVLNSLAGEKLHASVRCLALHGRFLELGKYDLVSDTNIRMSILLKDVSIHGIGVDQLRETDSRNKKLVVQLLSDGIASGVVKPLPTTVFGTDHLQDAFRYMANGKHIGKVLINMEATVGKQLATARTYFYPNKCYIIIGGLGGMGFELAIWLVKRGARFIVLNSRTGLKNSYQEYHLRKLKSDFGATISIDNTDCSTPNKAIELLKNTAMINCIGGIFNAALVLQDAIFENQNSTSFQAVCKAKCLVTQELDSASRALAPTLDYFVVFSSIVAARGNPGQTNYGYANSFIEDICERRKEVGLPALAIQWGAIGDVGVVAENQILNQRLLGILPQRLSSWLQILDTFLQQEVATVGCYLKADAHVKTKENSERSLLQKVANVLGIKDLSGANFGATFLELGMDSLMDTEIRQLLNSKHGGVAPILKELTLENISEMDSKEKLFSQTAKTPITSSNGRAAEVFKTLYPMPEKVMRKLESLEHGSCTIFIVHPIQGTLTSLEALVSELNGTFYGIECSANAAALQTVEEAASYYIEEIKRVQPNGPYKLAGYSYGGAVAFEMVNQLETKKEKVDLLLLLDSFPLFTQVYGYLAESMGFIMDMEGYLTYFVVTHVRADALEVRKKLISFPNWNEKVKYAAQIMHQSFPDFEVDAICILAKNYVQKLKMLENYRTTAKIYCKTVLFKCLKASFAKHLPYDYGLNKMCHQEVEICEINGDHEAFDNQIYELNIPGIINNIILAVPDENQRELKILSCQDEISKN